jgi:adenylylsulfate kinase
MDDSAEPSYKTPGAVWHQSTVTRSHRERLNGHRSAVLWFTGLSGAGKSTLAYAVEEQLHSLGCRTYVLDGDNMRHGLCGDLGYSIEDRHENIRRVGEVSKLMADAGVITLAAFISPLREDREWVRRIVGHDFVEIHCRCPIEVCESRDTKGLYRKARAGSLKEFTGISSPYEEPLHAELVVDTATASVAQGVQSVLACVRGRGIIAPPHEPGVKPLAGQLAVGG